MKLYSHQQNDLKKYSFIFLRHLALCATKMNKLLKESFTVSQLAFLQMFTHASRKCTSI